MSTSDGFRLQRVIGDTERSLRDLLLQLALEKEPIDVIMALAIDKNMLGKLETSSLLFTQGRLR